MIAAGIDAIHSVGIPGHSVTTMKQIVQGIEVNDFSRGKMDATAAELTEERDAVAHLLPS